MLGKTQQTAQRDLFRPHLLDFIDQSHDLVLLADHIDWNYFEEEFSRYYSAIGRPSMPIRFSVGCLLLIKLFKLSDETIVQEWESNPYMQYFTGGAFFEHKFPCDPSDFCHFRKRIGEEGIENIFAYSVSVHGKDGKVDNTMSDTTVQENNTTFPTDSKLAKKIIDKCNSIAKERGIVQRQTYIRKSKEFLRDTHNSKHPKRRKSAQKARKKLRTIALRLIRELERKLGEEMLKDYQAELDLYKQVLHQERTSKNKIYSLHKPFTTCIAKGKAHTPYEFGNKIGVLTTTGKEILILAIDAFDGNPHDSKTIEPLLKQNERLNHHVPKDVAYDRGGRGVSQIGETTVSIPKPPLKRDSQYERQKKRKKFRRRAGIEPVIGHLKTDFGMQTNYLHGKSAPKINAMLAATAWNLKKYIKKLRKKLLYVQILIQDIERGICYQMLLTA
ncbi:MAG: IS5 family transposase [Mangrovibacterium sp.]